MTGLILLCLLMSTQHPIQRSWLGIQLADPKMLKWDQYPFHNKTLSISESSCHIFWLSRDAYSPGRFVARSFCQILRKLADLAYWLRVWLDL